VSNLLDVATAGASVIYPAATEDEINDPDQLVVNYRRALGRERMLWAALGLGLVAYVVDYVRRGPARRKR
jgi:hypothetical protein